MSDHRSQWTRGEGWGRRRTLRDAELLVGVAPGHRAGQQPHVRRRKAVPRRAYGRPAMGLGKMKKGRKGEMFKFRFRNLGHKQETGH